MSNKKINNIKVQKSMNLSQRSLVGVPTFDFRQDEIGLYPEDIKRYTDNIKLLPFEMRCQIYSKVTDYPRILGLIRRFPEEEERIRVCITKIKENSRPNVWDFVYEDLITFPNLKESKLYVNVGDEELLNLLNLVKFEKFGVVHNGVAMKIKNKKKNKF